MLFDALNKFLHDKSNQPLIDRLLSNWPAQCTILAGESDEFEVSNIAYPPGAKDETPRWHQDALSYPLEICERIGFSGWSQRGSVCVFLDIDSIENHAAGIDSSRLEEIIEALKGLNYVELRRSTSGLGYHIIVHLNLIPTTTTTEHAALARHILGKICFDARFKFEGDVDKCGRNSWVYTNEPSEHSFELVKAAQEVLGEKDVQGWQEHIAVIQNKTRRTKSFGISDEQSASLASVPKDSTHEKIINALKEQPFHTYFNADYGCLHTHTLALEAVHKRLNLKGAFETLSDGKSPFNCAAYLKANGQFYVVRLRKKAGDEHSMWDTTSTGLAAITYNAPLPFLTACRVAGGVKIDGSSFTCKNKESAETAASVLGLKLPELPEKRPINFILKQGLVRVEVERKGKEFIEGFAVKRGTLVVSQEVEQPEDAKPSFDDQIRYTINSNWDAEGYIFKRHGEVWGNEGESAIKHFLRSKGSSDADISDVLGTAMFQPWKLTEEPFQSLWQPGRIWNRFGKQLITHAPGPHPTYDAILRHLGSDLDFPILRDAYCQQNGIYNGADYLRLWSAWLVTNPKRRLPVLVFIGRTQAAGKSSFHRALSMLIDGDEPSVDIARALKENFNASMRGAVLGFVDDMDLAKGGSFERVKSWSDSPRLPIRAMNTDQIMVPNYLHLVLTANYPEYIPLDQGDERCTAIHVPKQPVSELSQADFEDELQKEAPHFLHTLLNTPLPKPVGRSTLPIINTTMKRILSNSIEFTLEGLDFVSRLARQRAQETLLARAREGLEEWTLRDLRSELFRLGWEKVPSEAELAAQIKRMVPALNDQGLSAVVYEERVELGKAGLVFDED